MITLLLFLAVLAASAVAQLAAGHVIRRLDEPGVGHLPTGQAVAECVVARHDLGVVAIEDGDVDCYLAARRAIQFGDGRRERASLAAVAIGAHEAGHLLQHASGYRPWRIWWALALPALLADGALVLLIPARLLYPENDVLAWIGIALLAVMLLAGVVSCVVEVDASRRAIRELRAQGLGEPDLRAARRLLVAAGATYVTEAMCDLGYLGRRLRREGDDDEEPRGHPGRSDDDPADAPGTATERSSTAAGSPTAAGPSTATGSSSSTAAGHAGDKGAGLAGNSGCLWF